MVGENENSENLDGEHMTEYEKELMRDVDRYLELSKGGNQPNIIKEFPNIAILLARANAMLEQQIEDLAVKNPKFSIENYIERNGKGTNN